MKKTILLLFSLTLLFSFAFAQKGKARLASKVKVQTGENHRLSYPLLALYEEKEGLVICRIYLDEAENYQKHELLYATHEVLAKAVNENLPEMGHTASPASGGKAHFLATFVFELQKGAEELRPEAELFQDAAACKQYGFSDIAMHFYDQLLQRQRKANSDQFELNQARAEVLLHMKRWADARQEVTHMLAEAREEGSPYAHLQSQLRVQRCILSLLSDQTNSAIADINWLDRYAEHNIFQISEYIDQLHLPQKQTFELANTADYMQSNMPTQASFWLEGIATVALGHAHQQSEAYERLLALLEKEAEPELQAALLCQIGWNLYNQAKPAEALAQLQEATRLSPQMAQAHFYKALSLARLDYSAEAYESMYNAVTLGLPDDKQEDGQQMLSVLAVGK